MEDGRLNSILAPLRSDSVTTIVGFTEIDCRGRLYNSAAVFHKGVVAGIYRKLYPAINKSVYEAGDKIPVFTVGKLTFGIVICLDSTYSEPARLMAAQGAVALFVPTNNGLPPGKAGPEIVGHARNCDIPERLRTAFQLFARMLRGVLRISSPIAHPGLSILMEWCSVRGPGSRPDWLWRTSPARDTSQWASMA